MWEPLAPKAKFRLWNNIRSSSPSGTCLRLASFSACFLLAGAHGPSTPTHSLDPAFLCLPSISVPLLGLLPLPRLLLLPLPITLGEILLILQFPLQMPSHLWILWANLSCSLIELFLSALMYFIHKVSSVSYTVSHWLYEAPLPALGVRNCLLMLDLSMSHLACLEYREHLLVVCWTEWEWVLS